MTFLLYTLTVAGAIGTFTGLYAQLQEALGASKRIFELLDEPPEVAEAGLIRIQIPSERSPSQNVDFRLRRAHRQRVVGTSTSQVKPGEVVALVGPSGAGKTTSCS